MYYFINYNAPTDHVSVNTYRNPAAAYSSDVEAVIEGILIGQSVCCALRSDIFDDLGDLAKWEDKDGAQQALDVIRVAVREHEEARNHG